MRRYGASEALGGQLRVAGLQKRRRVLLSMSTVKGVEDRNGLTPPRLNCSTTTLQCCEDLCLHKLAPQLYANVLGELDSYAAALVSSLAADGGGSSAPAGDDVASVRYLGRLDTAWKEFTEAALTVRRVCTVLDRSYAVAHPGVLPLWDAALGCVRRHVDAQPQVVARAVAGMLAQVQRERTGEAVNRALLRNLLRMLSSLGLYATAFEKLFLQDTAVFYAAESAQLVASLDVPSYLRHADARLQEEAERAASYPDVATRKQLLSCCEAALVAKHVSALLDKGFGQLMSSSAERLGDLGRLYALAARVGALDAVRAALGGYVREAGSKMVKDEAQDEQLVSRLLEFKAGLDAVHKTAFCGNEQFGHTMKDAFEVRRSRGCSRSACVLPLQLTNALSPPCADVCQLQGQQAGGAGGQVPRQRAESGAVHGFAVRAHQLVRCCSPLTSASHQGNKAQSEEELEALLDSVLVLFRFLSGKDVFEAFYKKDLAKRLLLHRSASVDAEKSMLGKLKGECGAQFTSKMEGMFRDMDLSRDVTAAFREAYPSLGVETSCSVLTAGFWPSYPADEVALPRELDTLQAQFQTFYLNKHGGRKLAWRHALGSCVLRARFASCGVREIAVSVFQTAVLMLFNDVASEEGCLSFADIKCATRLEDGELRRTLQSLACGKVRILTKSPKGKDIGDGDTFAVNDSLQEARYRIKVNTVQLKETQEEVAAVNEKVQQDRQYQVDAAIVRIMKTRRVLAHAALLDELVRQLQFECKREDLKKRIESLIDREYLERDAGNAAVYKYLA